MTPTFRKTLYAVSFETCGILVTALVLLVLSNAKSDDAFLLSASASIMGMIWSFVFNSTFEAWEARQATRGRSPLRRLIHSILFETTLLVMLLPLTMWWLSVSLWTAIGIEIGVSVVFVGYTYVFTWVFDRVFGLPTSAR